MYDNVLRWRVFIFPHYFEKAMQQASAILHKILR